MLSDKDIEHVSYLARIKLTEKEKSKFKKELSSILDYVNKLKELDTENVKPLYQTAGTVNALRPDKHRRDFETTKDLEDKLIGQAPQRENKFVKVRSVLKK